jgi:uncharacterized membrane protein YcaP (DUF421 family)
MGTIIRAACAYWFLLFTIRVIGRRAVNQMTPFELILIFLIGGMSIQAIVADDRSLLNAFLAIMTVAMNHVLVAYLKQRFVTFRKLADGTPIMVVERGNWYRERLYKMRLQEQDIMAVAREQGIRHFDDIETAIVERNGSISIYKKQQGSEEQRDQNSGEPEKLAA